MAASSAAQNPSVHFSDKEEALYALAWEQGYKAGWSKPDDWVGNPYGEVTQASSKKAKACKAKYSKAWLEELNQQRFDYGLRQQRGYQVFLGASGWLWYSEKNQAKIAAIRTQENSTGIFEVADTDWIVQVQKPTARMWADIEHPEDMLVSQCIGWQYNGSSQTKRAIRQLVDDELQV